MQYLQENTCVRVSFWWSCSPSGLQLYYKETPTQVFFSEYCEIFKNIYFEKHLWTTASVNSKATIFQESLAFLPFKWNVLTSGICNLVGWFSGQRFKLEAKDFIFHIPLRSFPNFGLKILVLCSARSLWSFYFSLFCSQLVYTCSKIG